MVGPLLVLLGGCGAADWAYDRYINPPPPRSTPLANESRVRIEPPKPLVETKAPISDSRPDPPPSTISEDSCADMADGGPVNGPGCVTAVIQCDQTVIGHTVGGTHLYDSEWYDSQQCTPAVTDHDGGDERIYRLDVPDGDWTAFVTLYTPCADLDLAGWLGTPGQCPPERSETISRCDESRWPGRKPERLTLVTQHGASWYLIVEGVKEQEGLFSLSVQCRHGLF